ncbi:hypothetical protein G9P44_002944 [Scheffersomyces stipitis]|nr:hypothetical protein G9P44_002944 [Scheffersomyces stipitis]
MIIALIFLLYDRSAVGEALPIILASVPEKFETYNYSWASSGFKYWPWYLTKFASTLIALKMGSFPP